jgi:hypothetical protein
MLDKIYDASELLPAEKLHKLAEEESAEYNNALPYAHGVYDGIFSEDVLDQVVQEFDSQGENWFQFSTKYELKMPMYRDQELRHTLK